MLLDLSKSENFDISNLDLYSISVYWVGVTMDYAKRYVYLTFRNMPNLCCVPMKGKATLFFYAFPRMKNDVETGLTVFTRIILKLANTVAGIKHFSKKLCF